MKPRRFAVWEGIESGLRWIGIVACGISVWGFCQAAFGQTPSNRVEPSSERVVDDSTPQEIVTRFRKAVKQSRWGEEYNCYTPRLKSRFTYFLCQSTRELDDTPDRREQVQSIFQERRFSSRWLVEFPSLRSETFRSGSEMDAFQELDHDAMRQRLQLALDRWSRDVYPGETDWQGLIEDLQPLFEENFQRHRQEHHVSQTGIVWHLGMHWYEALRDGEFRDPDHFDGTIVARERAGSLVRASNASRPGLAARLRMTSFLSSDGWLFQFTQMGSAARPAGRIALIRQPEGWKIDEVPYR